MIIGVPKEIKNNENRVGLVPSGVKSLKAHGHTPPILRSQNLPGAIEYNRELGKRYKGRLSRQLA